MVQPALEGVSRGRDLAANGGQTAAASGGAGSAAGGGAIGAASGGAIGAASGGAIGAAGGGSIGAASGASGGTGTSSSASVGDSRFAREVADVEMLLCGSPREVLARIVPGDPLAIRDAVATVLRAQCLFLDADRVHLRALARTARAALRYRASGLELCAWLIAQASDAVAEILAEDLDAPRVDPRSAFVQFARPLGLDPEVMRRGCVAFNRLPVEDRTAFFALVVEDVGLEEHARASGTTTNEVGRRARRGLEAVVRANHPDLPPLARAATPRAASAQTTDFRSTASLPTDSLATDSLHTDSLHTVRPVSIPPPARSASARSVPREEIR